MAAHISRGLSAAWRPRPLALALLATVACGGGGGDAGITGASATVASISVSPASLALEVGGTATLQARALDAGGKAIPERAIVWTSGDTSIIRVAADGRAVAVGSGSTEIAANAEGKFAKVAVSVGQRAVSTVEISPQAPRLTVGGQLQLTARTLHADGAQLAGRRVTWSSSDPRVVSVDTTGLLDARAAGSATVQATSEGRTASVAVTVAGVAIASIALAPAVDTIFVGQSTELVATPRDSAGGALRDRALAWTSRDEAVATVSSSGLVLGVTPGSTTIAAAAEGRAAEARIVVLPRPVGAVIVSPSATRLAVGDTARLATQVTGGDGTLLLGRQVAYRSSDTTVARVDPSGLVRATGVGTASIVASSEGRSGTATVVVTPAAAASLEVTPPSAAMTVGDLLRLRAVVRDAAGTELAGRRVVWTTGAPSVVAVSDDGELRALAPGSAVVLATADGRVARVEVTVRPPAVASIRLTPASGTLVIGQSLALSAAPLDAAGRPIAGRAVTFASSDDRVATVTATGVVQGVAPGVARITATADGIQATAAITVVPVPVAALAVAGAPTTTFLPGQTAQLTAGARDAQGNVLTGRPVAWSSNNPSVATVSGAGVLSAVAPGTATITATVEGVTATASVTVSPTPIASVAVTLNAPSLTVGQSTQAVATPRDAAGASLSGRAVTWSTSNAGVATVSATGMVSAVGPGTATITATVEGQAGSAAITVTAAAPPPPPPPVPVATVGVGLAAASLTPGQTTQATATARDAEGNALTGRAVAWSSSNPAVATVSAAGVVSAVAPGTAAITATVEGKTGSASVAVVAPAPAQVATVTVTLNAPSISVGQSTRAVAVTRDAAGNVLADRAVSWTSSNPAVATVAADGMVTAVTPGSATITATSEGRTGSAGVTVTAVTPPTRPVASVSVTPASAGVVAGQSTTLTATPLAADGTPLTGRAVTWSSNAPAVATVDAAGVVRGVAPGTAVITATSEGRTGTASVNVTPVPVASVAVTLSAPSLTVGQSTQAAAAARDAQGDVLSGRPVTWSTSNPAVATVSASGVVTAVAPGSATITASVEGKTGGAAVTVAAPAPAPVATVTVALTSASLTVGQTTQATATPRDAQGNALVGRDGSFASSNTAVATVSAAGVVTALAPGTASITATIEGKTGGANVTVVAPAPAPVATVTLALAASTLAPGQTTQGTATTRDASGAVLTGRVVTFSTSNPAVATVSATGLVTAVTPGSATITATSEGKSGVASLTVAAPPVATVTVALAASAITVGQTTTATATARSADGTVLTGRTVTWTSSNPAVASVSSTGTVMALLPGSATITATSEGKTGTAQLTVQAPVITRVELSPGTVNLELDRATRRSAAVAAVAYDALGRVVPTTFTWTSSDPTVATVSASADTPGVATVTAAKVGDTTVTATAGGVSASTRVRVREGLATDIPPDGL